MGVKYLNLGNSKLKFYLKYHYVITNNYNLDLHFLKILKI